jgi:hypothetical protein
MYILVFLKMGGTCEGQGSIGAIDGKKSNKKHIIVGLPDYLTLANHMGA